MSSAKITLLFNFALEYAIRKVQKKKIRLFGTGWDTSDVGLC
jgi:hypothetical protein